MKKDTIKYSSSEAFRISECLYRRVDYLNGINANTPSVRRIDRWQSTITARNLARCEKFICLLANCLNSRVRELPIAELLAKYCKLINAVGDRTDQIIGRSATAIVDKLLTIYWHIPKH